MTAAAILLLIVALSVITYALERRIVPDRQCWRCTGVGVVQRWYRLSWKPCPRCGGTGRWSR